MQGAAVAETAAAAPQPLQSAAQAADQLPVPQAAAAEAQPRPAAAPFVVPKVPCYQGTCQVSALCLTCSRTSGERAVLNMQPHKW